MIDNNSPKYSKFIGFLKIFQILLIFHFLWYVYIFQFEITVSKKESDFEYIKKKGEILFTKSPKVNEKNT